MRLNDFVIDDSIDFAAYMRETEGAQHVRCASTWLDEIEADFANPARVSHQFLPWDSWRQVFGIRRGEVTVWAGQNGSGKSLVTGMVALDLIAQGDKVGILSFEMAPKQTLLRMLRQFVGMRLDRLGQRDRDEALYEFRQFAMTNLWLYDQRGTCRTEQALAVCRYMAKELGVRHVFIDSLMKIVAGEDDYNGQKLAIDQMCAMARDFDIHVHLVHHMRKGASDEHMPDKAGIKGSGSITDQVDNVLLVWRNKRKEHARNQNKPVDAHEPDAILMCEKQRNGDGEGWLHLWFDGDSTQYTEAAGGRLIGFKRGV